MKNELIEALKREHEGKCFNSSYDGSVANCPTCELIAKAEAQSGEVVSREDEIKIADLISESLIEDIDNLDSAFSFDEIAGHVFEKIKHFIQAQKTAKTVSREITGRAIADQLDCVLPDVFGEIEDWQRDEMIEWLDSWLARLPKPAAPIPSVGTLAKVFSDASNRWLLEHQHDRLSRTQRHDARFDAGIAAIHAYLESQAKEAKIGG